MTNNNDTANLALGDQLINDSIRRICAARDWDFLQKTATTITNAGTQFYNLPYDYNTLIDVTITSGSTLYIPIECPTREMWDQLNQQTTFQSNFPEYYFIFNGQLGFYPTPSTSSLTITFTYRRSVVDLGIADYSTGTISATNASSTLTGSGTTWTTPMIGRFIRITATNTAASSGDNAWYEISAVPSATSITLKKPYNGTTMSGGAYVIGQMSALPEAYQDIPVYDAASVFYTTLNPDASRAKTLKEKTEELFTRLTEDHGTKTLDPAIHDASPPRLSNPNNFLTFT